MTMWGGVLGHLAGLANSTVGTVVASMGGKCRGGLDRVVHLVVCSFAWKWAPSVTGL